MSTVKQVIVIRKDLGMRRGKEIAQGSHASMAFLVKHSEHEFTTDDGSTSYFALTLTGAQKEWLNGKFRKVVCQMQSEAELVALHEEAVARGLESHLITDLGATDFHDVPTITCLAIGPDQAHLIDAVTGGLKLY